MNKYFIHFSILITYKQIIKYILHIFKNILKFLFL